MTRQVNTPQMRAAMGARDGDVLTISNQWAKVHVAKEDGKYVVSGDLADIRAHEKPFHSLAPAMAYAFESLAAYERGACR